jgi:phosphoribosylformylglycinamidine cyclo-ligase
MEKRTEKELVMSIDYKSSGVDIQAGNAAVDLIKDHAASTFSDSVLTGLGSFGSFYDISEIAHAYRHPVMVQSIDGVGTKIMIASMTGDYSTIGRDLLSACCNDIIVHGAEPATFLDYIANDRLDPRVVAEMVAGMAAGCREQGVSLVGGETAEMPGTYRDGEHDLVGLVTGFVEKEKIINGSRAEEGDVLIGAASSGLHTNGYSLARKVLFDHAGLSVDDYVSECPDRSIGEILLAPHINYTSAVHALLDSGLPVTSMAHITGGGLIENIPRTLPEGLSARIDGDSWEIPGIFNAISRLGSIDEKEMFHAFNMGIGYTVAVAKEHARKTLELMREFLDRDVQIIGSLIPGERKTIITGVTS